MPDSRLDAWADVASAQATRALRSGALLVWSAVSGRNAVASATRADGGLSSAWRSLALRTIAAPHPLRCAAVARPDGCTRTDDYDEGHRFRVRSNYRPHARRDGRAWAGSCRPR